MVFISASYFLTLFLQIYTVKDIMTAKNRITTSPKHIAKVTASSSSPLIPERCLPYVPSRSSKVTTTGTDVSRAGVPESLATTTMCASLESFR